MDKHFVSKLSAHPLVFIFSIFFIIPRFEILFDNVGNDSLIWNMRWFGSIESSSLDHAL